VREIRRSVFISRSIAASEFSAGSTVTLHVDEMEEVISQFGGKRGWVGAAGGRGRGRAGCTHDVLFTGVSQDRS